MHSSLIHLFESSEQPVREGGVVIPILQMWSLRHREVSWFASEIPAQVLLHHQPCGVLAAWRQSKGACIFFVGVSGNMWSPASKEFGGKSGTREALVHPIPMPPAMCSQESWGLRSILWLGSCPPQQPGRP